MQKAIILASKISKQLDKNWTSEIEEVNLHRCFEPIFRLEHNIISLNTLVCAIIYSYDNESKWIDLRQDGYTINKNILSGLGADIEEQIFKDFIHLSNHEIVLCIGNYLDLLPDWRFVTARKQIDYHSKYIRESESSMTEVDEDKKIKARENIGRLLKEAISQRKTADELILQIEKDYVKTNHRVEQDFNSNYTQKTLDFLDDSSVTDAMSWRQFVKIILPQWKETKKMQPRQKV